MSETRTLAIDPGTTTSGVVIWDATAQRVLWCEPEMPNDAVRAHLLDNWSDHRVVCEWIQAMGMPVGREVFETCRFIGRLEEICVARGQPIVFIQRPTVKARLCGSARAKDANVRQALLDRVGPRGTKKSPGPTYGVSGHAWNALAAAIAMDIA